jgi:hypothetical protein
MDAPEHAEPWARATVRAFALHALGRTDESRIEIERAVKLYPRTAELLPHLGLEIAS